MTRIYGLPDRGELSIIPVAQTGCPTFRLSIGRRLTPCPPLTNPKVFKLALGEPHCTDLVAVLDDDTVLPPGALDRARAALSEADLATGLPWYDSGVGPWNALVAGFVLGANVFAVLGYLLSSPGQRPASWPGWNLLFYGLAFGLPLLLAGVALWLGRKGRLPGVRR